MQRWKEKLKSERDETNREGAKYRKNYSLNRETEPSHAPSTLVTREQKSRVFGARVGGLELMG